MTGPPVWTPYCGVGATPADLVGRWNGDPLLLAAFGVLALLLLRWRAAASAWAAFGVAALISIIFMPLAVRALNARVVRT